MAVRYDGWMEPPWPEIVCLDTMMVGGRNSGGRLFPSLPACVTTSQEHPVGHGVIQNAELDGPSLNLSNRAAFRTQYKQELN